MKEYENTRTGLQRAVDLAYAARAARRILQAAAAGGLHGAAAVAVKETAPFLVKRLLAVLVALIVLPMVIFTALPNIFFGYSSSDTDAIAQMTGQAMTIGGVYMSLDDFEAAQIDSVVTGIVAEYEESGTNIDRIEVSGSVTEKDLLWIIAINSAAYRQDLNAMSADLVRNFCKSSLSYFPSLGLAEDGGDGVVTTLTVKVKHLDPDELMDELGFDEDAKQWRERSMRHWSRATPSISTGHITKPIGRITAATPPFPEMLSTAPITIIRSTYLALSIPTRRTTSTSPPTRYRRGRTTGAMCGVPTDRC